MGLFSKKPTTSTPAAPTAPVQVQWRGPKPNVYHRLMHVDAGRAGLNGVGGVYIIWHRGLKPGWVYVGAAADIGALIEPIKDDPDIGEYENRGGLMFAWAPFKPEFRSRVVMYLRQTLRPHITSSKFDGEIDTSADPFPVTPPGM